MDAYADDRRLYFFLDFISHNAWLAWHKAPALAAAHGLTLTPVPVVFGALLTHYGQVGPAEVPAKSRWMLGNVLRKARRHGIPIAPPASHPFNPLLPLRLACAVEDPAAQRALVDRLFRATWAEGQAVDRAEVLAPLVGELGLPASLLESAQSDAVKQRLRANTDAAIAAGVFGVPSMRVRGELFWGFDDLEFLDDFLSGRDPLAGGPDPYAAWAGVRPSVQRRRP